MGRQRLPKARHQRLLLHDPRVTRIGVAKVTGCHALHRALTGPLAGSIARVKLETTPAPPCAPSQSASKCHLHSTMVICTVGATHRERRW